jgi:Uma2 family endonuclease
MSKAAERFVTVTDLLALPDEGRGFEVVDGALTEKLAGPRHGGAQFAFGAVLLPYSRRRGAGGPGGWLFGTEVVVEFEPREVYRPDVAGWRRERLAAFSDEAVVRLAPDWACEILSPGNARNDTVKKKRVYHRHKVGHYWLLDPMRETLTVYRWTDEAYLEVLSAERGERVRAEPFGEVELDLGVFFDDA